MVTKCPTCKTVARPVLVDGKPGLWCLQCETEVVSQDDRETISQARTDVPGHKDYCRAADLSGGVNDMVPPKLKARGAMPAGQMNNTEAEYGEYLEMRYKAGEIVWYKFEGLKLRLANNTFYTPDYPIMLPDGLIEIHEVKGFWTDDARVKIKVAAAMYPFKFVAVQKVSRKDGGGWKYEHF